MRFSKKSVAEWVRGRIDRIAENNAFDLGNGTSQVAKSTPERNRAYGEIMALEAMCDVFCLMDVKLDGE